MKVSKICQYCGAEYFVPQNQVDRSKFCSDACFRKSKNKRVEYHCDYCGKLFLATRTEYDAMIIGEKKHLYCSRQCARDTQKPKWEDIVSLFQTREYILLSTEYVSAKEKLEYLCSKHMDCGPQYITYNNLKNGYGCRHCGIERTAASKRRLFDEAYKIFDEHNMELLQQEYINTDTPMMYICKHHPEFGIQYMSTSNAKKQHCPHCDISKGEDKIAHFLLEKNIVFQQQKTYDNLLGLGGGKLSYDFYLPNFNLLIEYQGEQHEHPVEQFGGEEQFAKQQEHDRKKREYAAQHQIKLLEIWYYEISNIEQILERNIHLIA